MPVFNLRRGPRGPSGVIATWYLRTRCKSSPIARLPPRLDDPRTEVIPTSFIASARKEPS